MSARKPADPEWVFTDFQVIADAFGLSKDAVTVLSKEDGFPVFSRKICPALMKEWLSRNSEKLRGLAVS